MAGKTKIRELTSEWYGFNAVSAIVHLVLALFGSGLFAFFTVPLVLVFSVVPFALTWIIGRLLLNRSSVTRTILLVLAPISLICGALSAWTLVTGPWSLGTLFTGLLLAGGIYMQVQSFRTLIDRDVRAYFR